MPPPLDPKLLIEHRDFMISVARGLLRDAHEAEDVAQDGVLAALRSPPRDVTARAWFGAVARNLSRMRIRGATRRAEHERCAARPEAQAAPDRVARVELQKRIVEEVLRLSEPYRETVIARFLEGQTVQQIAAAQGVSRETVKTRLRRALGQLRARLHAQYGGESQAWSSLLVPLVLSPKRPVIALAGVTIVSGKSISIGVAIATALVSVFFWYSREPERPVRSDAARSRTAVDQDRGGAARIGSPVVKRAEETGTNSTAEGTGSSDPGAETRTPAHSNNERTKEPWLSPALVGTVVDESGARVAGATVGLANDPVPTDTKRSWTTDATGNFRIEVPAWFVGGLWATSNDARGTRGRVEPGRPCEIVLRPATASLRFMVRGANGDSVSGAKIESFVQPAMAVAHSAVDGSARIDGQLPGTIGYRVQAEGYYTKRGVVSLRMGEVCEVDVSLRSTDPTGLTCVDKETGATVAQVQCFVGSDAEPLQTSTASDGTVILSYRPARVVLRLEAPGYAPTRLFLDAESKYRVEFVKELSIVIALHAASPASLVRMEVPWGHGHLIRRWQMKPGEERTVDALPRAATIALRADAPGHAPWVRLLSLPREQSRIEIRFDPNRRLTAMPVRLQDPAGYPVAQVRVSICWFGVDGAGARALTEQVVRSDADGQFHIQGVLGELYRMRFGPPSRRPVKPVQVTLIQRNEPYVIEVPTPLVVAGSVVDSDGKARGGVYVFAYDGKKQVGSGTTVDAGTFRIRIRKVSAGRCTLRALIPGTKLSATQEVRVGDVGVRLVLEETEE